MLSISDNNNQGTHIERSAICDLLHYGNKSLNTLCAEHEGLLVFPPHLKDTDDKLGDETIFSYTDGKTEGRSL